jgi:hypothetical protein
MADTIPKLLKELQEFIDARNDPRFNMYDEHGEKADLACVQALAEFQKRILRVTRAIVELILQIRELDRNEA